MLLADFDYDLPENLIAQMPCEPRDHARMLVVRQDRGDVEHRKFYNLKEYLREGDTLIFNDTRVIPARLFGNKATGGKVEVFLLTRKDTVTWEVLVKPGKNAKIGTIIYFADELSCEIMEHTDFGGRIAKFNFQGVFEEILDRLGKTPLPPYIKTELENSERYQTVYARERGSAAAPTAGLHFTQETLDSLQAMGIKIGFVTLHVGLGTFRPVNADTIEEHVMHREYYNVPPETAVLVNQAKADGRRVVAIGTTAVRTLESAASSVGVIEAGSGWTEIFIYPGYKFKIVDVLLTNFHLPKSTLLMLISAFAGKETVLQAYAEAIQKEYRFFSFGDAMLLLNEDNTV